MFDKEMFAKMRTEFEEYDKSRESIIKTSRDVLKLSKSAIYSLQRGDFEAADTSLTEAKQIIVKLNELCKCCGTNVGAYNEAMEEFVEASCLAGFLKNKTIPTANELGVESITYLLGLCDVVGELVRKAINASISENYDLAVDIHKFVTEIYSELMLFDFPNSNLRRKYDSIKYGVEKLENLMLELKLKDKLKTSENI
jgi:predicted translin family RNA/ssDNA-binding protein